MTSLRSVSSVVVVVVVVVIVVVDALRCCRYSAESENIASEEFPEFDLNGRRIFIGD